MGSSPCCVANQYNSCKWVVPDPSLPQRKLTVTPLRPPPPLQTSCTNLTLSFEDHPLCLLRMAESSSIGYAPFCTIFQVLHMSLIRCKNAKNILDCHTCTTNMHSPSETISMDYRQKALFQNDLSLALLSLQHL